MIIYQCHCFVKCNFCDLIATDLAPTLRTLDRLRILSMSSEFELTQRYDIDLQPVG